MPGPIGPSNPFSNIPPQPQGNLTPQEQAQLGGLGQELQMANEAGDLDKEKEVRDKIDDIIRPYIPDASNLLSNNPSSPSGKLTPDEQKEIDDHLTQYGYAYATGDSEMQGELLGKIIDFYANHPP